MGRVPVKFSTRLLALTVLGVSFGIIEASVVIYLRDIYYPEGFAFPVVIASAKITIAELIRELATLVLLFSTAFLIGRSRQTRLAIFGFLFGVWDIVYYLHLKIMLGWPESLFTWDVLFLLPTPWAGPVWAPVVVSAGLVYTAIVMLSYDERGVPLRFPKHFWFFELLMGLGIIITFLIPGQAVIRQSIPADYHWILFWLCFTAGISCFEYYRYRYRILIKDNTPAGQ